MTRKELMEKYSIIQLRQTSLDLGEGFEVIEETLVGVVIEERETKEQLTIYQEWTERDLNDEFQLLVAIGEKLEEEIILG